MTRPSPTAPPAADAPVAAQPAPSAPAAPGPDAPGWARWFVPAAVVTLLLDQATKWWLFSLPHGTRFPDWIALHHNTGVAWSMGQSMPGVVAVVTAVLIPLLAVMWWRWFRRLGAGENLAFGLILGGAVGNGIDRLCAQVGWGRMSGVRDFIHVDLGVWPANPWPTFNIADSGICVGFIILVALSFAKPAPAAPSRALPASDP